MALGTRISERLKALKMNQSQLARKCGIPQTTVNSIIKEDRRSSPHLMKLAAALRTTPAYLLGETDDPDSEIAEAALSFEERELIDVTRQLGRDDFTVLTYIARRLVGGGAQSLPPSITDRRQATVHDRQLGYKSG